MMTLIADLFQKLSILKDVLRQMFKKSCFLEPYNKQHGKRVKTLLKGEFLPYLLIPVKAIESEKVLFSDMQNLKTIS